MNTQELLLKKLNKEVIDVLDSENLQLTVDNSSILDELNKLCQREEAYRLGTNRYIGYKYLWNLIFNAIKMESDISAFKVDSYLISENLINKILTSLEKDNLIKCVDGKPYPILEEILSIETVTEFCWGRADKFKIEYILNHFGFKSTCKFYDTIINSPAYDHTKNIIKQLCIKNIIQEDKMQDYYSWVIK